MTGRISFFSAVMIGRLSGLMLAFCALLALPQQAHADAIVTQADARVTLLRRLTLVNEEDLDFGRIIPSTNAGQVTMTTAGACTATNGIVAVSGCSPAVFAGYGTNNQQVLVRLTSPSITLTGPGASMSLSNMVMNGAPDMIYLGTFGGGLLYRINTGSGVFDFRVAGRLNVNANQAPGQYAGQFVIRVDYF